ncbi:hypothetical protein [Massilia sp. DD77]|uniref:hypothetical protein n=1 Tax=Massilia sp. DD77 TaxID=3109349 RepID=UPI002FFE9894
MSGAAPARRAIRQADAGIGAWLGGLVTGAGSSPSHIIVTAVLGVIPGVGQAMDARDLILGVIAISKSPASVMAWADLVISLIGCIPAAGDALKAGFKLMKQGHSFGRILEAVSPKLRGNVERFMRNLDWGMLTRHAKSLFGRTMDAFIDAIDSWMVKVVAGRGEVAQMIAELRAIQRRGPQMIDSAFAELKKMHARMLGHDLPRNTAAVTPTASRPRPPASRSAASTGTRTRASAPSPTGRVSTRPPVQERSARAQTNNATTSTRKAAKKKKQSWRSGIPAEHITDYYVRRKHAHFRKANNSGRLIEEHSLPHNGLDHLWHNNAGGRPFVVGETKSSIFDSFALLGALPAELRDAFDVLRENEAANPTKSGQPNIFHSEERDRLANRRVRIGETEQDEKEVSKGLNRPNPDTGLATQMSHKWIFNKLRSENLTTQGAKLTRLIRDWRDDDDTTCPYFRWISLVTGRQLHKHRQSGGANHEVQTILNLPDNILDR